MEQLLARAVARDLENTLDCETDDELPGDCGESREGSPFPNLHAPRPSPPPIGGSSSITPSAQQAYAPESGKKRARSPPPAPAPAKKSKHARKHKKARYARAEQREREGLLPRPKVIKRNILAGDGIKTGLDSQKLPVAHGAYVAKNAPEPCASKKYLPADLDAMGFTELQWDGQ